MCFSVLSVNIPATKTHETGSVQDKGQDLLTILGVTGSWLRMTGKSNRGRSQGDKIMSQGDRGSLWMTGAVSG